jgi:hypothetical protein
MPRTQTIRIFALVSWTGKWASNEFVWPSRGPTHMPAVAVFDGDDGVVCREGDGGERQG